MTIQPPERKPTTPINLNAVKIFPVGEGYAKHQRKLQAERKKNCKAFVEKVCFGNNEKLCLRTKNNSQINGKHFFCSSIHEKVFCFTDTIISPKNDFFNSLTY